MKKKDLLWSLLAIIMAATVSVGLSSCDDPDPDEVTVYPPSVSFSADGGQQTISVKSNTKWTITGMMTGVTIAPTQGSGDATITVIVTENTEKSARNGVFYVNAGDASATINVSQAGKNQSLADRVEGVYSGRLMLGETVMEDAYIVKIIKQTDTTVSVDAPFFGGETYNFNLSENGNQILFSNSTMQNFSMSVMGNQVSISYLSSGGNMLTYSGTK